MVSKHFLSVYTTEIVPALYNQSKERARQEGVENITFLLGDSVEMLKEITPRVAQGAVFFLDVVTYMGSMEFRRRRERRSMRPGLASVFLYS